EPGFRIETRRRPIGSTAAGNIDQRSGFLWLFFRIGNRLALRIDSLGPVHADESRRDQVLSIRTVEHKEVAVSRCLREHLARLSVEYAIEKDGRFDVVPIMRVMRGRLKIPDQFSGVRIQ